MKHAPPILVAANGVVLGILGYHFLTQDLHSPWWQAGPTIVVAWAFLAAGLIAHVRRPESRLGLLMLLVAFGLLVRKAMYSGSSGFFTFAFLVGGVSLAAFAHAVLAYPSGRLSARTDRRFVRLAYALAIAFPLAMLLVYDSSRSCVFRCASPVGDRPHSLILVWSQPHVFHALHTASQVTLYGVLSVVFLGLIARRLIRASPRSRRLLAPVLIAGAAAALRAITEAVYTFVPRGADTGIALFFVEEAVQIAVPIALLLGLLYSRLARATVADLVRELETTPPSGLRDAIARTLGDRTLQLAYWVPESRSYVDDEGRRFELPTDGPDRAVTVLSQGEEPIAALVHDPGDDQSLVESVAAAARLALGNVRLQAELRAQLGKVRESRARIVAAADTERRRIERDLHDGAQQRLVALALDLRRAQLQLGHSNPEFERVLDEAVKGVQAALEELRELAHGVHPAILTEEGLGPALESLAARSPLPTSLSLSLDGRVAPEIEAAVYFVSSEALANAAKHAEATAIRLTAARQDGRLVLEIVDDGVGGARARNGSGLRGSADRLEALGGRLRVESPPGGGTRVVGEVPCGS